MNTENAIRVHIKALRDEVDRQHHDRHAAIDKLETDLLGAVTPHERVGRQLVQREKECPSEQQTKPQRQQDAENVLFPNTTRVMATLRTGSFRTVAEICDTTGLEESTVRGALNSPGVKRQIDRKKRKGHPIAFRIKNLSASPNGEERGVSAAQQIRDLLAGNRNGLTAGEICDQIAAKIPSTASSPKNTVGTALYNMKKSGKLLHDEDTGKYVINAT